MVSPDDISKQDDNKTLNELKIKAKLLLKTYRKDPASLPKWAKKAIQLNLDQKNSVKLKNMLGRAFHVSHTPADTAAEVKLKNMLSAVSRKSGFIDWQHASHVLGGTWQPGEDAGTFWYSPKCQALLNNWCRNLVEAEEQLALQPKAVLFPYKKQFIIAGADYVNAIGLHTKLRQLQNSENRNLIELYARSGWDEFTYARVADIFTA